MRHETFPSISAAELSISVVAPTALRAAFTNEGIPARDRQRAAKALIHRHVLMADLLPWWSANTKRMSIDRINEVPFYSEWKNILREWISTFEPQAIIVNACGDAAREAIRLALDVELRSFSDKPRAYFGTYVQTPLFVHPQLNGCRELSHERYRTLAEEWQARLARRVSLRLT